MKCETKRNKILFQREMYRDAAGGTQAEIWVIHLKIRRFSFVNLAFVNKSVTFCQRDNKIMVVKHLKYCTLFSMFYILDHLATYQLIACLINFR